MAQSPCSRRRGPQLQRRFSVSLPAPPASAAGGAAHAAALYPLAETVGKINGVLQSLLAPANGYWRSLHHFRPPLRRGHANMVDRSLIPATDQAEKVVRSGENHQQRDQRDSDSKANFLRSFA
jgi:hypothetical protein